MTRERAPCLARVGSGLVLCGLALQLALALHWTPGTFVLSAALGVPLVFVGCGTLGVAARRAARSVERP